MMVSKPAYFVVIPTVVLILLGLVMVFSASTVYGLNQNGYRFLAQQIGWAVFGFGLMLLCARIDYHRLARLSLAGVLLSIALLVAVRALGTVSGGARLGIEVGPLYFQPTELAKFTMVIFAAYALSRKGDKLKSFAHLLVPVMVLAALEAALMLMQPDLGSALIMLLAVLLVMFLSKSRVSHVAAIGAGLGVATAVAIWKYPYMLERIKAVLYPWKDPQGYGYQVIQSKIALGSGSLKGLGLGMSRQKFLYLPNAHNDFIFAIVGEELGLLGTLAVVLLVGLLTYGGLKIASGAPDELGKLIACGITGLIVVQALVNMGGVTGLLPITGVPLPFVSSGGSSLCVTMGCTGILLNVASHGSR